jgi:general nucleoside transport system permease protein
MWASIAGLLKVYRGVSEVISTIMLNSLSGIVISYLLVDGRLADLDKQTNIVATDPLPSSSHFFTIPAGGDLDPIWGFIVVAALAGVGFWFLLGRTRFGFDLRAVGRSESAAQASGVNVKRMVLTSMLLSGAMAGLIGMPTLLNDTHQFTSDFPTGIGFTGIAIALLGRNNPIGIAFAALLWGFLEQQSNALQITAGVSDRLVLIIQGVIVLSVVIAYEIVRRANVRIEQRTVAQALERQSAATEGVPA